LFACSLQAQVQQRKATFHSWHEKASFSVNPPQPGFKPERMVVPAKRNIFNPSNSIWKWDTILCYDISSQLIPFQRVSRTYNSFGEELTNLFERRQGSMTWENYARESFTYDSAGNWVGHLQEIWQNNAWLNFMKQNFAYDTNGNWVEWTSQYWDSTFWSNDSHYSYHFNSNGLKDTTIYQVGQDSLWVNQNLWFSIYDNNGWLTSVLSHTWINNGWAYYNRSLWTYDANGYRKTLLQQNWENASWVNSVFYQYSWDPTGNIISNWIQDWQNNSWLNMEYMSYLYDSLGNKIIDLTQYWLNGSWVNSGRYLYEYDNSSNKLAQMSQTWDNSYWRNNTMQQYTYDSSGNSLTGKVQWWYQNSWQPIDASLAVFADHQQDIVLQEIYRYSTVLDSILVFIDPTRSSTKLTLFPNPAHSIVYVSSPDASTNQNGTLILYDLRGQMVLTKQIVNETTGIDVSGLNPGVYFVRFSNDRMTRVLKLVKE
jgi:hypothetical protein